MSDSLRRQYEVDDIYKIKPAVKLGVISIKGNLLILGRDVYQIRNVAGLGVRNVGSLPPPPFPLQKILIIIFRPLIFIMLAGLVVKEFPDIFSPVILGIVRWIMGVIGAIVLIMVLIEINKWRKYDPGEPQAILRIYMNSGYVWKRKGSRKFMQDISKAISTYMYSADKMGNFEIMMEDGRVPQFIINKGTAVLGDAIGSEFYNQNEK